MTAFWTDLTSEDFTKVDPETWVAVMPVGAIEQHGPHLPVSVDADINEGIVAAALRQLPADAPVVVLPMLPIGKSDEHLAFRGTLTLKLDTLLGLWTDVGESVARAGFRKLVILNSHGGQPQAVEIVARDLRIRLGMFVVSAQSYGLGKLGDLFSEHELRYGIHGGEVETSMMLHLRPETVRRARMVDYKSSEEDLARDGYSMLTAEGTIGFGWMTQDLNLDGAAGDARHADAERGRQSIEIAGKGLADLLLEVSRYPLDRIKAAPNTAPAVKL